MKYSEFEKLCNTTHSDNNDKFLKRVKQKGTYIQYVKDQTPEICMVAVKENEYALALVDKSIFDD